MHAVLHTLNRLGDLIPEVDANLSWIAGWIDEEWVSAQGGTTRPELPAALRTTVGAFTDGAIDVMGMTASTALFRGEGVLEVGELLREGIAPDGNAGLRTVLNAAWAERLRDREKLARIERALAKWQMAALEKTVAEVSRGAVR